MQYHVTKKSLSNYTLHSAKETKTQTGIESYFVTQPEDARLSLIVYSLMEILQAVTKQYVNIRDEMLGI